GRACHASDVLLPEADDAFRVVTADAVDAATVRVTVRYLPARLLSELVDANRRRSRALGARAPGADAPAPRPGCRRHRHDARDRPAHCEVPPGQRPPEAGRRLAPRSPPRRP